MKDFPVDDFILESNAIEGIYGEHAGRGSLYFDNHLEAYRYCRWAVSRGGVTPRAIRTTHRKLLTGLDVSAGKFRSNPMITVRVGGYVAPPAHKVKALITSFCAFAAKAVSVEDCWASHFFFESVHPFLDGNGRTGRCLLNAMLRRLKHDQVIIRSDERFEYYRKIEAWRKENQLK